jgi:hypothetical protein
VSDASGNEGTTSPSTMSPSAHHEPQRSLRAPALTTRPTSDVSDTSGLGAGHEPHCSPRAPALATRPASDVSGLDTHHEPQRSPRGSRRRVRPGHSPRAPALTTRHTSDVSDACGVEARHEPQRAPRGTCPTCPTHPAWMLARGPGTTSPSTMRPTSGRTGEAGPVEPSRVQVGESRRSADAVDRDRATPNLGRRSLLWHMLGSVSLRCAAPFRAPPGVDPTWLLLGSPGASRG